MADILLTGNEIVSNADLLANTRLTTIPGPGGLLHFECSTNLDVAANNFLLKIELPWGGIPIDGQRVPANGDARAGVLDRRTLMEWTWEVLAGGHFIVGVTLTGTAQFTWLARLI